MNMGIESGGSIENRGYRPDKFMVMRGKESFGVFNSEEEAEEWIRKNGEKGYIIKTVNQIELGPSE